MIGKCRDCIHRKVCMYKQERENAACTIAFSGSNEVHQMFKAVLICNEFQKEETS